jgi:hypothetical protein
MAALGDATVVAAAAELVLRPRDGLRILLGGAGRRGPLRLSLAIALLVVLPVHDASSKCH